MVQTRQKTACSFILTATNNYIARVYTWRNRVLQRALEGLELLDAKVSRAVLRGRGVGNSILLPDTDVKDAEWITELVRHGLLKASFIPSKPTRDLRDLVRYRKTLVQERAREVNRLQKVLETANIKLSSVGSLVMGKSGQRMVAAMIEGGSSAEALADLARGTLRRKLPQLQQARPWQVQPHHQVLLGQIFAHISYLEHSIQHLQLEIDQRLSPFEEAMRLRLAHPWHSGDYGCCHSGGNRL